MENKRNGRWLEKLLLVLAAIHVLPLIVSPWLALFGVVEFTAFQWGCLLALLWIGIVFFLVSSMVGEFYEN